MAANVKQTIQQTKANSRRRIEWERIEKIFLGTTDRWDLPQEVSVAGFVI